MKFQYLGVNYKIWFKYPVTDGRRETVCLIDIEGSDETYTAGSSVCAKSDQFSKEKGRKIALTRAIGGYGRPFRQAAWNCYLNRATAQKEAA